MIRRHADQHHQLNPPRSSMLAGTCKPWWIVPSLSPNTLNTVSTYRGVTVEVCLGGGGVVSSGLWLGRLPSAKTDVYGGKILGKNVQILTKIFVGTFGSQTFCASCYGKNSRFGSNCSGCGGN